MDRIYKDVLTEVEKVDKKYGNYASTHEMYGVLAEEVDEFWDGVKNDLPDDYLYSEAVQIAAVCFRIMRQIKSKENLHSSE